MLLLVLVKRELITSSKITLSKVIKLIEKSGVDHFVKRYLWAMAFRRATSGVLPLATNACG